MVLYYRNPIECIKTILSNPIFAGCINFVPERVYTSSHHLERRYSEWMTSEGATFMQVSITLLTIFFLIVSF